MYEKKYIKRNDGRTICFIDTELEKAPIIVFLHGWGADLNNLKAIYMHLTDSYRVISIDLPGFGESTRPIDTWGSFEYADEIINFLNEIGVEKYSIAGHSFGGKIASIIAYKKPEIVNKIVLIAANCLRNKRSLLWYFRVYSFKIARFIIGNILNRNDLIERIKSRSGSEDYRTSIGMQDILVRTVNEDLKKELTNITVPVFLYWGEKDTATPVWMAKKISTLINDCGLFIVKNGSHYPFLEDNRVVSIIKKFI